MNAKEKKAMKQALDYIWEVISSKDLQRYKFGYHTKIIAKISKLMTIIKFEAKKEVFSDLRALLHPKDLKIIEERHLSTFVKTKGI